MEAAWLVVIYLLMSHVCLIQSCLSRGYSSGRARPGFSANREPLIYGQYIPNRSELSISASGPTQGKITRNSPKFSELVENHNTDIVYKDNERTGADRIMSKRCKDKLDSLSIMVMNQWPGVKLRVIEAWDEEGEHAEDSLHYEGRAVDISTNDRDKKKLSLLARLAYNAGFDYVSYESRHHIHCSVKQDAADDGYVMEGGCFSSKSYVAMADGVQKSIEDLRVHDKVLSADPITGDAIIDTVIMFMDISVNGKQDFIRISYDGGHLEATRYHLLYVQTDETTISQAIYSKDITLQHLLLVNINGKIEPRRVRRKDYITQHGYYAPVTMTGNIIVNNVIASCYSLIYSHNLAHFSLAPYRLYYNTIGFSIKDLDSYSTLVSSEGIHWYGTVLSNLFFFLL